MKVSPRMKIRDMTYIALFAVVIAVCSWISVPGIVPFTMQTFGVFLAVDVLGGKRGSLAVLVYLLLGIFGAPVFAGFSGGLGYVMGSTGGYIVGFLFSALCMWMFEVFLGRKTIVLALSMVAGLIVCYLFGTIWFVMVYSRNTGNIGIWAALTKCVFPYVVPDTLKIALALTVGNKLACILKIAP